MIREDYFDLYHLYQIAHLFSLFRYLLHVGNGRDTSSEQTWTLLTNRCFVTVW